MKYATQTEPIKLDSTEQEEGVCMFCDARGPMTNPCSCAGARSYQRRAKNQLEEGAHGNPIHNKVDDECCPDFSCCIPGSLAEEKTRQAILKADEKDHYRMLLTFLGGALRLTGTEKDMYVAGDPDVADELCSRHSKNLN